MTSRQPKGIPIGGEFAANAHDDANKPLGASLIVDTNAGKVRSGDVVYFSDESGEKPHLVTRVERLIGLDRREQVRLSFDGVPAESLGEGAGVYWSTARLKVARAPREEGRSPRELDNEIKAAQRKLEYMEIGDGSEFTLEEQDAVVAAALDPGATGMTAARARRAADVAEARNFHPLAIRLRAAAERHRLSEDPMSKMHDPYSIAASPDSTDILVIQAITESPDRSTFEGASSNPNAPSEALDIMANDIGVQGYAELGGVRQKIANHPNASSKTRAAMRRIGY